MRSPLDAFSRQLIHWVASLFIAGAVLATSPPAQALLDDMEKDALAETFDQALQAKTLGEFISANKAYLDVETYLFLKSQTQGILNKRLPKIRVQSDSRVSFKIDGYVYKLDFVSVRTQLVAINGREVEFLPNEKPAERWTKLMMALQYRSASASPLLRLLEDTSYAAGKKPAGDDVGTEVDPKRLAQVTANLKQINALLFTSMSAAPNKTDCKFIWDKIGASAGTLAGSTQDIPDYDSAKKAATAGLSPDLTTHSDPINPPSKTRKCLDVDKKDLEPDAVKNVTEKGSSLEGVDKKFFQEDMGVNGAEDLSGEQINQLARANILNKTFKWKLQVLRDRLLQLRKEAGDKKECYAKAQENIKNLLATLKSRTKSSEVTCYIDQISTDIEHGAPTFNAPGGAGSKISR